MYGTHQRDCDSSTTWKNEKQIPPYCSRGRIQTTNCLVLKRLSYQVAMPLPLPRILFPKLLKQYIFFLFIFPFFPEFFFFICSVMSVSSYFLYFLPIFHLCIDRVPYFSNGPLVPYSKYSILHHTWAPSHYFSHSFDHSWQLSTHSCLQPPDKPKLF